MTVDLQQCSGSFRVTDEFKKSLGGKTRLATDDKYKKKWKKIQEILRGKKAVSAVTGRLDDLQKNIGSQDIFCYSPQ